jgi:methylphosphotriester-DNA--protein-cysteine methyltransferase
MSVDHAPHKARRRPRANKKPRGGASITDAMVAAGIHDNASIAEAPAPTLTPEPMSFATKIGLALQGSNWQDLQNSNTSAMATSTEVLTEETVAIEDELRRSRQATAKQLKKLERLGATIVRDTGEVLQTIQVDSVIPVEEDVRSLFARIIGKPPPMQRTQFLVSR